MTPLDVANAENARLRETIADLQFENRLLRCEAAGDNLGVLGRAYGLRRTGAAIVHKLWVRSGYVSSAALAETCLLDVDREGDDLATVRTHVCYARRALGAGAIENRRGFGYRLSDAARAALTELFTD